MDILRKELNEIYASQQLSNEIRDAREIERCKGIASAILSKDNGCTVITDASCDHCYVFFGALGRLLGLTGAYPEFHDFDSSDEDMIYNRIHPEDLVDKRMLEYEFFKYVDAMPGEEKVNYQATCRIRMRNEEGQYVIIDNSTQVICPSPNGRIWLILCCYALSSSSNWNGNISPRIKNNLRGEIMELSFHDRRQHLLSEREKEILNLIKEGKLSKEIADRLRISIHTVNRHRQNILEKLSVNNSIEAIVAAEAMRLL